MLFCNAARMMHAVRGWLLFFLVSFPALDDAMKQVSPMEFWRHHRCESLSGYLNIEGIPRHHCVLNCIERSGCEFMNYKASARHCQLGTGMCKRRISDDITELIIFGSMDHLAGLQLIPANQFITGMTTYASDSTGGKLAVLINDEHYTPGSFKNVENRFEAPLERPDASGRDLIQTTNLEELFVIVPEEGYEYFVVSFFTGNPGAVVDERAVLGGYQTMDDGETAKLYILNFGGRFVSYNSVTGNGYTISDTNPITINFYHQLVCLRKVPWIFAWIWNIACRCCPNYIFILNSTPGFNALAKDNCETWWKHFSFGMERLILEVWR